MKILKYLLLIMILWGVPSFFAYDESVGSKLSYLLYILLLVYYFLNKKNKLLLPFLILGLLYYLISGSIYVNDAEDFTYQLIKYFIFIICGAELARNTTKKELFLFLVLGASSVLIHALVFPDGYGRYSGFYLDPNGAGFVCIVGYCLSFNIEAKKLKLLGLILLTVAGLFTFSRTFIILWLLVNLIAVFSNKKNFLNFGFGIALFILGFSLVTFIEVDNDRLSAFQDLLGNDMSTSSELIQTDSRLDTWSTYYDLILDRPFFGNGYGTLSGLDESKQGVHNSFLMVFGEAGILPFLLIIGIYLFILSKSLTYFKTNIHKTLLAITLIGILMVTHNYFDNNVILFSSIWILIAISRKKEEEIENQEQYLQP